LNGLLDQPKKPGVSFGKLFNGTTWTDESGLGTAWLQLVTKTVKQSLEPFVVFGTGVDSNGKALAGGGQDPHFSVDGKPATLVGNTQVAAWSWQPNRADAAWISLNPVGAVPVTTVVYTSTFSLEGYTPETASLTGTMSVDDVVKIILNDKDTGAAASYSRASTFNITSGFVPGNNTLKLSVYNSGGPSGVFLQISGKALKFST